MQLCTQMLASSTKQMRRRRPLSPRSKVGYSLVMSEKDPGLQARVLSPEAQSATGIDLQTEQHVFQRVTLGLGCMAHGSVHVAECTPTTPEHTQWPADGGELPVVERSVIYKAGKQRLLGMSGKPVSIVIPRKLP